MHENFPVTSKTEVALKTFENKEHLPIPNDDVLIKTTYRNEDNPDVFASVYILVGSPTSIGGMERINQAIESEADEGGRATYQRSINAMNKPLVFRDREHMKEWLEGTYYSREEARVIAEFLGIQDIYEAGDRW
jgi:hypothetical protein